MVDRRHLSYTRIPAVLTLYRAKKDLQTGDLTFGMNVARERFDGLTMLGCHVTSQKRFYLSLVCTPSGPRLASLWQEAAGARLRSLLSRLRDVPALQQDDGAVAQDLAGLLLWHADQAGAGLAMAAKGGAMSTGLIWTLLAVPFFAAQFLFTGSPGPGE